MKRDHKQLSQAAFDQQAATYDTGIQGSHARALYPYLLREIGRAWGDRVLEFGGTFLLGDCWLPLPGRLLMNPFLRFSHEGDVKLYGRREIEALLGQEFHQITWKRAAKWAYVAGGVR